MKEKEEEGFDYEEDLRINPSALDIEWVNQPQKFMLYSEAAADARSEVDRAKENVDVVSAEVDLEVRTRLITGGTKVTEAQISSGIILDKRYKEATSNFLSAKHKSDILSSAVRAFDQRKEALENLVRLQGQQYFAGPSEPRNIGEELKSYIDNSKKVRTREKIMRSRREG